MGGRGVGEGGPAEKKRTVKFDEETKRGRRKKVKKERAHKSD